VVGVLEDIDLEEMTVSLSKGDRLFLYTDGIPETMNENKEMIEFDMLLILTQQNQKPKLDDTLDAMIKAIEEFRGKSPVHDDIVLIGFEVQ